MKGHIITLAFFVLAIIFYGLGAAGPATGLLLLGVLAEGTFWYRLFGNRNRKH